MKIRWGVYIKLREQLVIIIVIDHLPLLHEERLASRHNRGFAVCYKKNMMLYKQKDGCVWVGAVLIQISSKESRKAYLRSGWSKSSW
jgi:hypothetical protein